MKFLQSGEKEERSFLSLVSHFKKQLLPRIRSTAVLFILSVCVVLKTTSRRRGVEILSRETRGKNTWDSNSITLSLFSRNPREIYTLEKHFWKFFFHSHSGTYSVTSHLSQCKLITADIESPTVRHLLQDFPQLIDGRGRGLERLLQLLQKV